ncbi:MAG: hypothetical protein U5K75_00310 [Ahrensia sp.]|nr:hypothetical protein [Ahrensia sp.]
MAENDKPDAEEQTVPDAEEVGEVADQGVQIACDIARVAGSSSSFLGSDLFDSDDLFDGPIEEYLGTWLRLFGHIQA